MEAGDGTRAQPTLFNHPLDFMLEFYTGMWQTMYCKRAAFYSLRISHINFIFDFYRGMWLAIVRWDLIFVLV
jgi:hypothetical protein